MDIAWKWRLEDRKEMKSPSFCGCHADHRAFYFGMFRQFSPHGSSLGSANQLVINSFFTRFARPSTVLETVSILSLFDLEQLATSHPSTKQHAHLDFA